MELAQNCVLCIRSVQNSGSDSRVLEIKINLPLCFIAHHASRAHAGANYSSKHS
jgi:hypothetical protein